MPKGVWTFILATVLGFSCVGVHHLLSYWPLAHYGMALYPHLVYIYLLNLHQISTKWSIYSCDSETYCHKFCAKQWSDRPHSLPVLWRCGWLPLCFTTSPEAVKLHSWQYIHGGQLGSFWWWIYLLFRFQHKWLPLIASSRIAPFACVIDIVIDIVGPYYNDIICHYNIRMLQVVLQHLAVLDHNWCKMIFALRRNSHSTERWGRL